MAFAPELRPEDLTHIAWELAWKHFLPLALGGLAVALATLAFRLITTRFGFSLKKLAPDAARLSPLTKLKELPRQNLPMLLQSLILLPLFLWAVYVIARDKLDAFLALPLESVDRRLGIPRRIADGAFLEGFGSVSGVRMRRPARQMRRYKQDLRMSKQDIKKKPRTSKATRR
jgi:flagellar biosynthesis protein FlhB